MRPMLTTTTGFRAGGDGWGRPQGETPFHKTALTHSLHVSGWIIGKKYNYGVTSSPGINQKALRRLSPFSVTRTAVRFEDAAIFWHTTSGHKGEGAFKWHVLY